jgi:hypothetical protein
MILITIRPNLTSDAEGDQVQNQQEPIGLRVMGLATWSSTVFLANIQHKIIGLLLKLQMYKKL